jgi:hypothetical protein
MASVNFSDYFWQNQTGSYFTGNNMYLAYFTTLPGLDGTGGVEVSTVGTNYSRVLIAAGVFTGPTGAQLTYSNASDVTFGVPSASWGTLVGTALYDSDIGGTNNMLMRVSLNQPAVVIAGSLAPKFTAGSLLIRRAVCP